MNEWFEQQAQHVSHLARATEARVHALPFLGVLTRATRAYTKDRASTLAAALAYYALLSIFPLLLMMIAILSYFIEPDTATRMVSGFLNAFLPAGSQVIRNALQQVLSERGAVTILSVASFAWSATGTFDLIQVGINRAFCVERPRALMHQRLWSLGMVGGVGVLIGLSIALNFILRTWGIPRTRTNERMFFELGPIIVGLLIGFVIFGTLYRYVPNGVGTRWKKIWLGALVASGLWEIAKNGFAWYLTNIAFLNLVYGPLSAVIAVMLWSYVTAAILLFGAEIAAIQSGER